ncbi:sensor histidine kinase [Spirochaetia bacterium 38H-sp]|uniref:histidine kinase n=1 Tax=Rarispira pelagica TaxID=3141764 RepID=A0ABU9U9F7_9SPIR
MKDDYLVEGFISKKNLLEESKKDLYTSELYHRVKNDITLLMSYLSLKENELSSDADRQVLRSVISQFKALTVMYDFIVSSSNKKLVLFNELLERTIAATLAIHSAYRDIDIDFMQDEVCMSSRHAMPLLLVCNELITNAIKHSPVGHNLCVKIGLKKNRGKACLSISGGNGDFDPSEKMSEGYGLMLVKALASQADADISFDRSTGAWNISFLSLC